MKKRVVFVFLVLISFFSCVSFQGGNSQGGDIDNKADNELSSKAYQSKYLNDLIAVECAILELDEKSPIVLRAREVISEFFYKLDDNVSGISKRTPEELLFQVSKTLAEMGFSSRGLNGDDLVYFLQSIPYLQKDCDTGSWLYLAAAEVYKWPLNAVLIPTHCFIRWNSKKTIFNYETNNLALDKIENYSENRITSSTPIKGREYYMNRYNISSAELNNSGYYNSLTPQKLLSRMYGPKLLNKAMRKNISFEKSLYFLDYAVSLDPSNVEYKNLRLRIINNWAGRKINEKKYDKAIDILTNSNIDLEEPTVKDNLSKAHYNKGVSLYKQDKKQDALFEFLDAKKILDKKEYRKAIAVIFIDAGVDLASSGDFKGAIDMFTTALKNDPNNETAKYNYNLMLKYLNE